MRRLRPLGDGSQVLETCSSASCMITCLIYFTSQKLSAMTEPIYSDPRVSVRKTKGRLQWNRCSQPLMESQWTPELVGPGEQTALLLEQGPALPKHPSPWPVCYYRFTPSGWNVARMKGGGKEQLEKGRLLQLRPVYLDICWLQFSQGWGVGKIPAL